MSIHQGCFDFREVDSNRAALGWDYGNQQGKNGGKKTTPTPSLLNSSGYDENGVRCAIYCHSNGWEAPGKPAEEERIRQFQNIYRPAMKEAWEQPSTTE